MEKNKEPIEKEEQKGNNSIEKHTMKTKKSWQKKWKTAQQFTKHKKAWKA